MQIVLSKGDSKIVLKLQKSEGKVLFASLDKTVAYHKIVTSRIRLSQNCKIFKIFKICQIFGGSLPTLCNDSWQSSNPFVLYFVSYEGF